MTRTRHSLEVRERPKRRSHNAHPAHDRRASQYGIGNALVSGDAKVLNHAAVLQLQREAGNASVASFVGDDRPTVQRGLFDVLGSLLGGGGGGMQQQAAGLAGQGVQSGVGALSSAIGGPFGQILGGAGSGLAGAASSLIGGNTGAALSGLQSVGATAAGPLGQAGMSMLGGALGGPAGGLVSGLGSSVGQGLSSIISGGSAREAGMGVLGAAAPGLKDMAARFLGGI